MGNTVFSSKVRIADHLYFFKNVCTMILEVRRVMNHLEGSVDKFKRDFKTIVSFWLILVFLLNALGAFPAAAAALPSERGAA